MLAELLERRPRGATRRTATAGRRLGELHHRGVHPRFEHVGGRLQACVLAAVRQIGAIAADRGGDRLARLRVIADRTRQAQELQRPFQVELARQVLGDRGALGILAFAELDVRPEPPRLALDLQPGDRILAQDLRPAVLARLGAGLREAAGVFALRIVGAGDERAEPAAAQRELACLALGAEPGIAAVRLVGEQIGREELVELRGDGGGLLLHHLAGARLEVAPEGFQHRLPLRAAAGHVVQLFLQLSGIVEADVLFEEALEERGDESATLFSEEAVLLDAHVIAVLQRLDDRGIGRRATDAEFLHPLDQRRFGEARRWLGEMLFGGDVLLRRRIAVAQARQAARFLVLAVVLPFLVQREEAGEEHDLAGRAQHVATRAVRHLDRGALHACRRHLAGERALPNEVVQARVIAATDAILAEIGRADRLVRFLRVLRLGLILARRIGDVATVVTLGDRLARGRNGAAVHLHAVGAHVGDRAILIQALRDAHRMVGREAELARRLLLQRRGGEGRRRVARRRLGLDRLDREAPRLDRGLGLLRVALIADRQAVEFFAVPLDEARGEGRAVLLHARGDRPIFLRAERLDLALAVDDQAQRDRLHAAGRLGAGQLAPQHRRQREAD